jgi:magnesium transporter
MAMKDPDAPGIHAYARLESGVHAINVDRAADLLRGGEHGGDADPTLVWIDITSPGAAEAEFLRERCGFHPLAVEDCLRGRQRPKVDRYPTYLFLVFYAAAINEERHRMALNELHLFLGKRFIVSVHDHRLTEVSQIVARWRAAPDRLGSVGALAHALLDELVDNYFPVLDHIAERTEALESAVFEGRETLDMRRVLKLRQQLVHFRRFVAPGRDVFGTLIRRDLPFLSPDLLPYFQDVHDHLIRVTEGIDATRELVSGTMEAHMTVASNRLNSTMRMLTAWSIILMSMTIVAGIYGMNFAYMPELGWRWGYFGALALMLVIGGSLGAFFRARDWL